MSERFLAQSYAALIAASKASTSTAVHAPSREWPAQSICPASTIRKNPSGSDDNTSIAASVPSSMVGWIPTAPSSSRSIAYAIVWTPINP